MVFAPFVRCGALFVVDFNLRHNAHYVNLGKVQEKMRTTEKVFVQIA